MFEADIYTMGDKVRFTATNTKGDCILEGRIIVNRGDHLVTSAGKVTEDNFVEHIDARRAH